MYLGSNRELAGNKVILLYIIDKINLPVSSLQLTKIILENRFMNYFLFQQFLNELCNTDFLSHSVCEGKTCYNITPAGKQALEYFINLLPDGIKSRIDSTINEIRKNVKNEILILADYAPESENQFTVTCKARENNFTLIEFNMSVGSKNDALTICDNWKKHSQSIYQEIINTLLKKRERVSGDAPD